MGSGEARPGQSQGLGLGTGRKQGRHVPPADVGTSFPCLAGATTSAPGASWLSDVSGWSPPCWPPFLPPEGLVSVGRSRCHPGS